MMIKDLSISKELDSKALTDVRGGGQTIGSQTVAQSHVDQANLFGVQVSLNNTTANSGIIASNYEDNSTKFDYGYPLYWI